MPKSKNPSQRDNLIRVRALKNDLTRIVKSVREEHREYVVTARGEPVAVLRPYTEFDAEQRRQKRIDQELQATEELSHKVSVAWKSPQTAESILEQMREESAWR